MDEINKMLPQAYPMRATSRHGFKLRYWVIGWARDERKRLRPVLVQDTVGIDSVAVHAFLGDEGYDFEAVR